MKASKSCRQSCAPPRTVVATGDNATDDLVDRAARQPDHPMFARLVDGTWHTVSASEFAGQVTALAAGLIAAGIQPGDRVALMSATRYDIVGLTREGVRRIEQRALRHLRTPEVQGPLLDSVR